MRSAVGWGCAAGVFIAGCVLSAYLMFDMTAGEVLSLVATWMVAQLISWTLLEPAGILLVLYLMMRGPRARRKTRAKIMPTGGAPAARSPRSTRSPTRAKIMPTSGETATPSPGGPQSPSPRSPRSPFKTTPKRAKIEPIDESAEDGERPLRGRLALRRPRSKSPPRTIVRAGSGTRSNLVAATKPLRGRFALRRPSNKYQVHPLSS